MEELSTSAATRDIIYTISIADGLKARPDGLEGGFGGPAGGTAGVLMNVRQAAGRPPNPHNGLYGPRLLLL